MYEEKQLWQQWAETLQKWGVRRFVATFLEATSPMQIVGAQLLYIGQPLLNAFVPNRHLTELAHMLEQPETQKDFIAFLRDAEQKGNA